MQHIKIKEWIRGYYTQKCITYAKRTDVFDKIETKSLSNCFITLKEHNGNFVNQTTTRLINPTKNKIGKILLDKIKIGLCEKLKQNESKNTTDVINWFEELDEKHLHTFTIFNIKGFYSSIKEISLEKAVQFAAEHTVLTWANLKQCLVQKSHCYFIQINLGLKGDSNNGSQRWCQNL